MGGEVRRVPVRSHRRRSMCSRTLVNSCTRKPSRKAYTIVTISSNRCRRSHDHTYERSIANSHLPYPTPSQSATVARSAASAVSIRSDVRRYHSSRPFPEGVTISQSGLAWCGCAPRRPPSASHAGAYRAASRTPNSAVHARSATLCVPRPSDPGACSPFASTAQSEH